MIYQRHAVYNLLLECSNDSSETHSVYVNGIECVSLGHGINLNAVTAHPFFGIWTDVLSTMDGWSTGKVRVAGADQLVSNLVEC